MELDDERFIHELKIKSKKFIERYFLTFVKHNNQNDEEIVPPKRRHLEICGSTVVI